MSGGRFAIRLSERGVEMTLSEAPQYVTLRPLIMDSRY
jgi:hypothetical protein